MRRGRHTHRRGRHAHLNQQHAYACRCGRRPVGLQPLSLIRPHVHSRNAFARSPALKTDRTLRGRVPRAGLPLPVPPGPRCGFHAPVARTCRIDRCNRAACAGHEASGCRPPRHRVSRDPLPPCRYRHTWYRSRPGSPPVELHDPIKTRMRIIVNYISESPVKHPFARPGRWPGGDVPACNYFSVV